MRHAQSYDSFSASRSLLGGSTMSGLNESGFDVPPSTKVRVAQRMHLVPKTFYSVHDAQRQCSKMTKDFKELNAACEKIRLTVEEATTVFGHDGFKLQADLRDVTSHISQGLTAASESTAESMTALEVHCKGAAFVEPDYRKAYKQVIKAQEKLAHAQSHSANDTKIANLTRDLERKKVSLDISKADYDRVTLDLGMKLTYEFAQQVSYNCQVITEGFRLAAGIPGNPDGGSPFAGHNGVHREYTDGDHHSHYYDPEEEQNQEMLFTKPLDSVDEDEVEDISSIPERSVHPSGLYLSPNLDEEPNELKLESPTRILRDTRPLHWNFHDYSPGPLCRQNGPPSTKADQVQETSNEWNQWAQ